MQYVVSAIVQNLVLIIIPYIWWAVTSRKNTKFLMWLGIKKPVIENKRIYVMSFVISFFLLIIPTLLVFKLFNSGINTEGVATVQFRGQGVRAIIPAIIWSFMQTGLSEEILFRGFINKRLINRFGFEIGNSMQSIIFGLLHGVMFYKLVGVGYALLFTVLTGSLAYFMGWLNEKQSGGSIVSSWIIHGVGNLTVSIVAMFNIL